MIYARKMGKICIYQNFLLSLHRIWNQKLKPIENYESTMDEFGR